MDIREIYRLHQQYSQSPVTIDMGTAEDHAAAPALTYAAGAKRRWDQHKPALKVAAICCAFIALATIAGLGLGDLYSKKGRAASATATGPENVAHAVQTQAPAAPASAPAVEPAIAATQAMPAAGGSSSPSAPAAALGTAVSAAPVAQPQQTALSAAEVAPRERVPAPEKVETPPAQPAARRTERPAPVQAPVTRPAPAPQPSAATPRATTPPARTTEANRPSGDVKMF